MKKYLFALLFAPYALALTAFELPWMNHTTSGTLYKSAVHKSAVFVIEAYFYNCHYCHENAPNVDELADKYANESRVQVLDVGRDQTEDLYQSWIQDHKPNHPVLRDSQRVVIRQLGVLSYPSTFVVDCKGNVVMKTSGVWEADMKHELQMAIDNTLKTVTCD